MTGVVGLIGGRDPQLEEFVRAAGLRAARLTPDDLTSPARAGAPAPDMVIVDVREDRRLLASIHAIKRRHPAIGVTIVVPALDPQLMLEAMRAGVTECVAEPLTVGAIDESIARVLAQRIARVEGRVFAVIGAKGGVGATTVAVNLADAIARATGQALLIDLHMTTGDAALLVGAEPRFSVVEALENTGRLDEAYFRGLVVHTPSGLDLLAASGNALSGPIEPERIRTLVDFAARYYRAVVLDVPRADAAALDALESASAIFVVVNHELPTLRNAYRIVARLRQRYGGERVSLLVNRSDSHSTISIADIEKAVNARAKHVFPSDYKAAVAAANQGQPLARSNQGRLAASFQAFAGTLVHKPSGLTPAAAAQPAGNTFFGWLTPRRSSSSSSE